MRFLSVASFIGAAISSFYGFYRLFVYRTPGKYSFSKPSANYHVGGDAYNLIINGNHATAFFVLTLALVTLGLGIEIILAIKSLNPENETQEESNESNTLEEDNSERADTESETVVVNSVTETGEKLHDWAWSYE